MFCRELSKHPLRRRWLANKIEDMWKDRRIMKFAELSKIIFNELPQRLNQHMGLSVFAKERAKFEGWLKVEVCDILSKHNLPNVVPEKHRVDVMCDGWAIELKTVNTNYRYPNVINKHRPITINVQGVIDDIEQLRNSSKLSGIKKAVLFIVFPVSHIRSDWQKHLKKIIDCLGNEIEHHLFEFNNGVHGVIYFGHINEEI